ncbi:36266_t:CDS:2 [Gigaspora margarita]|uniref:36266_t:CDS:1 n=1 Tax=Gigaspora margarita TaxID=4874 RepID=A0ABN7V504_GIGMA|nr:36266_t:CDS:2 [Gigaspora margarita]
MNQLKESYKYIFQELLDLNEEAGYNLSPPVIITDFEQSVINAILAAFNTIKPTMLSNTTEIINYFKNIYIYGRIRQQLRNGVVTRNPPLFLPSVLDKRILVLIQLLRKCAKSSNKLICKLNSEPHPTQRKCLINYEKRILSVFNNCDTYMLVDFLRGIAHNISL